MDLEKKSVGELKDLLARQESILNNSVLCKRLPDSGAKVREKKKLIQDALEKKTKAVNDAAVLLSSLNISTDQKKVDVEEMEWKFGGSGGGIMAVLKGAKSEVDSDDDSDPENDENQQLKVLVEGDIPKGSSKPKPEDIEEFDLHSVQLSQKIANLEEKKRFMPFLASKSDSVTNTQTIPLQKRKNPPKKPEDLMPIPKESSSKTQTLDLISSLKLRRDQEKQFKELCLNHATEKLKASNSLH